MVRIMALGVIMNFSKKFWTLFLTQPSIHYVGVNKRNKQVYVTQIPHQDDGNWSHILWCRS